VVIAMDHPVINAPSIAASPPSREDEREALQRDISLVVRDLLDFHLRGRSIAEARAICDRLRELLRDGMERA